MSDVNDGVGPSIAGQPRLGERAVPFRVRTTHGERGLEDYRGRWLLLFSHPADFTPVCTSEFVALANLHDRFQALGCDLLGLSVDSVFAHIAWVRSIRETFGVEIPFPIAEDQSMAVAAAYGMIHPLDTNTSTVRASFLIDPDGILRLFTYYPTSIGRNGDEMLRALGALRQADSSGLSMPGDWRPGDYGLLRPPATVAEANDRTRVGAAAWYYQPHPVTE